MDTPREGIVLLVFSILISALSTRTVEAQSLPTVEISGGYSYLNLRVPRQIRDNGSGITPGTTSLSGWNVAVTARLAGRLGAEFEFSHHLGDVFGIYGRSPIRIPPERVAFSETMFLAGIRIQALRLNRWSISGVALIGAVTGRDRVYYGPFYFGDLEGTLLAKSVAISLDVDVTRRVAWRLIQPKLLVLSSKNPNLMLTTGLIVRLGGP